MEGVGSGAAEELALVSFMAVSTGSTSAAGFVYRIVGTD
jgi:hypothetical protein